MLKCQAEKHNILYGFLLSTQYVAIQRDMVLLSSPALDRPSSPYKIGSNGLPGSPAVSPYGVVWVKDIVAAADLDGAPHALA
jgi:hypothetical protein